MEQDATYPVIMAHLVHKERSMSRLRAEHPTLTLWHTEGPLPGPARTALELLKPLRTHSLSPVSIITPLSVLPTMQVPLLEGKQTPVLMWLAPILLSTPAPPPSPAGMWAWNSRLWPAGNPTCGNNMVFHRRQDSDHYQHFCKQTKPLITEPTPQYCIHTVVLEIVSIS